MAVIRTQLTAKEWTLAQTLKRCMKNMIVVDHGDPPTVDISGFLLRRLRGEYAEKSLGSGVGGDGSAQSSDSQSPAVPGPVGVRNSPPSSNATVDDNE